MKKSFKPFSTRLDRVNYWIGIAIWLLLFFFFFLLVEDVENRLKIGNNLDMNPATITISFLFLTQLTLFALSFCSLQARRDHDLGMGFLSIQSYLSFNFIQKGDPKENKYGKPQESKFDLMKLLGFYEEEKEDIQS